MRSRHLQYVGLLLLLISCFVTHNLDIRLRGFARRRRARVVLCIQPRVPAGVPQPSGRPVALHGPLCRPVPPLQMAWGADHFRRHHMLRPLAPSCLDKAEAHGIHLPYVLSMRADTVPAYIHDLPLEAFVQQMPQYRQARQITWGSDSSFACTDMCKATLERNCVGAAAAGRHGIGRVTQADRRSDRGLQLAEASLRRKGH